MIMKASAALRKDYASLSNTIYSTKNGEGDLVLMSIDALEKMEQLLIL